MMFFLHIFSLFASQGLTTGFSPVPPSTFHARTPEGQRKSHRSTTATRFLAKVDKDIENIFQQNRIWVDHVKSQDPYFFDKLGRCVHSWDVLLRIFLG